MHCKSCKMLIEDILDDLNITILSFDFDEDEMVGHLEVDTDKSKQQIKEAIESEGEYTVE